MGTQMDRGFRGYDRDERDDYRRDYDDRYRERYETASERDRFGSWDRDRDDNRRYDGWGGQSVANAGDSVQRGYGGGYGGQRMGYGGERMGYGRERMDYRRDVEPGYGTGGPFESQRGGHRGKGPAGYARSDDRIREDVNEALTEDDEIDASSIEVEVKHGEVTLSGQVPERRMKRLAEDCIERISGIKDVHNQIRVQERNEVGRNMAAQRGTNTGAMHSQSVSNAPEKDTDNGKRRGPSA